MDEPTGKQVMYRVADNPENNGRRCWCLVPAIIVCALTFYLTDHEFRTSESLQTETEETTELDEMVATGAGERRVAFAGLGIFGLALWLIPGRGSYRLLTLPGLLLLAGFGWCFASLVWAEDPGLTVRRLGVLALIFVAVMGLARQLAPRDLCWLVIGVGALFLVWGLFAELKLGTFRPHDSEYRFSGTVHPNTQGLQFAALILAAVCLMAGSRRLRWSLVPLILVAVLLLCLTKSRSSVTALSAGLLVIWLPRASRFWKSIVFVFIPFAVGASLLVAVLAGAPVAERLTGVALMGRTEEAGTLTGRLPLWDELAGYISERPLAGYGYGGFWNVERTRRISESQGWQIAHSHCTYIEWVLNIGLGGAAIMLLAVLATFVVAFRRFLGNGDPGYRFLFGMIVFAGVNSLTDAGFAQHGCMTLLLMSGLAVVAFSQAAPVELRRFEPAFQLRPGPAQFEVAAP
jgi:exopolysaccharide production protein ExoQ